MLSALIILGQLQVAAPPSPRRTVYVASEAVDLVSRVHFGPAGATVETVITVDPRPSENDGPHNLNISPDGEFAWVANFNLYGDMVPSSVSVVYTPAMQEVARIPTCLMPHGMRVAPDGSRAWMTCMMDDKVVELDPGTYGITRVLLVKPGGERVLEASRAMQPGELDQQHGHMSHDAPAAGAASSCAPTWGQPTADGQRLYVACNRHAEVLEVDAGTLTILRWIATGKTPYNLAISIDGRTLLATLGGAQALSVIDLVAGREVAQLGTSHTVPSGVLITPDGCYALVTCEGKAAEAGTVRAAGEVLDPDGGGVDPSGFASPSWSLRVHTAYQRHPRHHPRRPEAAAGKPDDELRLRSAALRGGDQVPDIPDLHVRLRKR